MRFAPNWSTYLQSAILWPPDAKNWLRKDPDAGKDWRWEEKGSTEDEMVGWHHWLHGHEFKQILGDDKGQGSLACCSSLGCKGSDTTEQLNNNNMTFYINLDINLSVYTKAIAGILIGITLAMWSNLGSTDILITLSHQSIDIYVSPFI